MKLFTIILLITIGMLMGSVLTIELITAQNDKAIMICETTNLAMPFAEMIEDKVLNRTELKQLDCKKLNKLEVE